MAPQEWGGCIFESCDISFENTPTPHAVSLALLCEHAVMIFCRALAYATTANVCLHLLMYSSCRGAPGEAKSTTACIITSLRIVGENNIDKF